MSRWSRTHQLTIRKTASCDVTHITVAASVAYAVTGDWVASLALSLLEPTVRAVLSFFHERAWETFGKAGSAGPGQTVPSHP